MSTNHTPNLNLFQWEGNDKVLRADFNADNQKIDAALAGLQQSKGNCRIVTGSYIGTGHFNTAGASTMTFDGTPQAVIVYGSAVLFALRGTDSGQVLSNGSGWVVRVQWTEDGLTWYSQDNAARQMNEADQTYYFIALLAAE